MHHGNPHKFYYTVLAEIMIIWDLTRNKTVPWCVSCLWSHVSFNCIYYLARFTVFTTFIYNSLCLLNTQYLFNFVCSCFAMRLKTTHQTKLFYREVEFKRVTVVWSYDLIFDKLSLNPLLLRIQCYQKYW